MSKALSIFFHVKVINYALVEKIKLNSCTSSLKLKMELRGNSDSELLNNSMRALIPRDGR